ncbi:SCO family protein [Sphingobacterium lactis]|uniref:SCO family protein n=1 Tax=Sphingobacterium lactis TaxID=797291 RepID=UPI003EC879EE
MKLRMKYLGWVACVVGLLLGCQPKSGDTQTAKKQPVVTEDLSDLSVYHLPAHWTNQDGEQMELKDLQGNVVVVAMIYTSCKAACPRLVADMRHIEKTIDTKHRDRVKFLLVSIDPETDTPEKLKQFAIDNEMDGQQWLFLRSNENDTREFAATLAVNYKKISPIDFSHSNIISLFNPGGELVYQQEGLGVDYAPTIAAIEEEANKL